MTISDLYKNICGNADKWKDLIKKNINNERIVYFLCTLTAKDFVTKGDEVVNNKTKSTEIWSFYAGILSGLNTEQKKQGDFTEEQKIKCSENLNKLKSLKDIINNNYKDKKDSFEKSDKDKREEILEKVKEDIEKKVEDLELSEDTDTNKNHIKWILDGEDDNGLEKKVLANYKIVKINDKNGEEKILDCPANSPKPVRDFFITNFVEEYWQNIEDFNNSKVEDVIDKYGQFCNQNKSITFGDYYTERICNKVVDNTIRNKNLIFYGPPGTGKTREAKIMAARITGIEETDVDAEIEKSDGRIKLLQFHPSYSYYDFVEGIVVNENGFELEPKVFKQFAERAKEAILNTSEAITKNINSNNEKSESDIDSSQNAARNNNYVLIIDEINRANMASVLGELLYALEYREKAINTGGGTLVVPNNLYIIGTMNTADVSIAGIDYAVRRRFDFVKMNSHMPDGSFKINNKECEIKEHSIKIDDEIIDLSIWVCDENDSLSSYKVGGKWFMSNLYKRVRMDVQNSVARGVNIEDIMPGISYFLANNRVENNQDLIDIDHIHYKIDYEIVPLLSEYAKNGLFSKRNKLVGNKSLYEMLKNMEYSDRLKVCISENNIKES